MEYQCLEGCGAGDQAAGKVDLIGNQFGNGCSGGSNPKPPKSIFLLMVRDPLARAPPSEWGHDQTLLRSILIIMVELLILVQTIITRRYIWRWARKDCLSHDSFHCSKFSKTKPFPTRRILQPNNFVGAVGFQQIQLSIHNYLIEPSVPAYQRQNHGGEGVWNAVWQNSV